MIAEAFLICALAPSPMAMAHHANFEHPIVSYHAAKSEQDKLVEWIRKKMFSQKELRVFGVPMWAMSGSGYGSGDGYGKDIGAKILALKD